MLAAREIEMAEVLRSSDGHIIKEFESETFVAIYDDKKFDGNILKDPDHCRNLLERRYKLNMPIIFLPKEDYDKLKTMIKDNYTLTEKEDESNV